jgi:hypothetical protein
VLFASLDIEGYERDHAKILEIGLATLDTRDLVGVPPGADGAAWRERIVARHFRIADYSYLRNAQFVTGCADRFEFGASQWIALRDVPAVMAACLTSSNSGAGAGGGNDDGGGGDGDGGGGSGDGGDGAPALAAPSSTTDSAAVDDNTNNKNNTNDGDDNNSDKKGEGGGGGGDDNSDEAGWGGSNDDHAATSSFAATRGPPPLPPLPALLPRYGVTGGSSSSVSGNDGDKGTGGDTGTGTGTGGDAGANDDFYDIQRNVVLVGHAPLGDMAQLRQHAHYDLRQLRHQALVDVLDVATLDRDLRRLPQPRRLGALLADLDITGWNLHNAGNDAAYALQAMVAMVVRYGDGVIPPSTEEMEAEARGARGQSLLSLHTGEGGGYALLCFALLFHPLSAQAKIQ